MKTRGRAIAWGGILAVALILGALWATQPSLDSAPALRVFLFAALGVAGAGLTLWAPHPAALVAAAVLLRLVLFPAPVSDDVHRYLWEGKLIRHGHSPYAQTAESPALIYLRDSHWKRMNHRERATAYPPLAQLIFAAVGAVAYHPSALKLVFLISDLSTLLLLLSLLRSRELPLSRAGWYAFNPVVLIGVAAEAHYDTLFAFALTACWWAAERKRFPLAWLALAASVQLKLVSLLLVPLLLDRRTCRSSWWFGMLLVLPALPFLSSLPNLGRGVRAFAGDGWFNGLPHLLLDQLSSLLPPVLLVVLVILVWFRWQKGTLNFTDASFWTLGGVIVLSPIVHFWYLIWIAPLLVLTPNLPWLVFSLSQACYFLAWQTLDSQGWWGLPLPIVVAMWLPFPVCLGLAEVHRLFRIRNET